MWVCSLACPELVTQVTLYTARELRRVGSQGGKESRGQGTAAFCLSWAGSPPCIRALQPPFWPPPYGSQDDEDPDGEPSQTHGQNKQEGVCSHTNTQVYNLIFNLCNSLPQEAAEMKVPHEFRKPQYKFMEGESTERC